MLDHKLFNDNIAQDNYANLSYFEKLVLQTQHLTSGHIHIQQFTNVIRLSSAAKYASVPVTENIISKTFHKLIKLKLLIHIGRINQSFTDLIAHEVAAGQSVTELNSIVLECIKLNISWLNYLKAGLCLNNVEAFNKGLSVEAPENILKNWFAIIEPTEAWLKSLNPQIQYYVVGARLATILDLQSKHTASDAEFEMLKSFIIQALSSWTGSSVITNNILIEYFIMSGMQDQLDIFGQKNIEMEYATSGIKAFLNNDNKLALFYFDSHLKLMKHKSKKILISGIYGVFYILSMIKENHLSEARELINTYKKGMVYRADTSLGYIGRFLMSYAMLETLLQHLNHEIDKVPNYATGAGYSVSIFDQAIFFLISFWTNMDKQELQNRCNSTMAGSKARFAGLIFVAEDISLRLIGKSHVVSSNIYGFPLSTIVDIKPEWEYKLVALDKILAPLPDSTCNFSKRLIWRITSFNRFRLEPIEQSRKKNGEWNKGRIFNSYYENLDQPHITSQDLELIEINKQYWEIDSSKIHLALVNHPLIFIDDQHIEIVRSEPELIVIEKGSKYEVKLSHIADKPTVALIKETDARYRVIELNSTIVKLTKLIGKKIVIPKDAKDRVLDMLQRAYDGGSTKSKIKIRAEVDDESIEGTAASSEITIQLLPTETGFKLKLLTQPCGAANLYMLPGDGSRVLLNFKKGIRTKIIRDLDQELSNALQVHNKIKSFVHDTEEKFVFETRELHNSLEVLGILKSHEGIVEWPKGEKFHIAKELSFKELQFTVKSSNQWFEFDGKLHIDETQVLEMKNLLSLLSQSKGRFIALDDKHFIALQDSFAQKLRELSIASKDGKLHELGAHMLLGFEEQSGSFEADELWRDHLRKIDFSKKHDPKIPKHLIKTLRHYQVDGYKWLSRLCALGLGCCLADDMGLGKTLQTIILLLEQAIHGPCLIVAPKSVCYVWEEECKKFAPKLKVVRISDANKEAREEVIANLKAMNVFVINYGMLPNLEKSLIKKPWQVIVLDEAQSIKNFNTKRFKIVTQLKGAKRIALTGTPVENHVGELWNLFHFLNPGFLGNRTSFYENYIKPIAQDNNLAVKTTLKKLVQPFMLRRVKEKVLQELPPKTEQTIIVEPSDEERSFYEALRQTSVERINAVTFKNNAGQKRLQIFAEITKLKRACCDSSLVDPSIELPNSKLKVLEKLLIELKENNHKVLIFSQYVDYLKIIKARLEILRFSYQYLDGSTSMSDRQNSIAEFQGGKNDVFLISLKAGGTGLTLTIADYVIHMDPWWNPAVEDQASARAHRMGQIKPVTIYKLVMKNSIEERIMDMHKVKRELATSLLEGSDSSARLTEEDLMKLVLS